MARERWFYAQGAQRRGPVLFDQLVDWVLGQPEPRGVLVWRKGFADWTRAEDVPEVEQRMASFLARKAAEQAARPRARASRWNRPRASESMKRAPAAPSWYTAGSGPALRCWFCSRGCSGRGPSRPRRRLCRSAAPTSRAHPRS